MNPGPGKHWVDIWVLKGGAKVQLRMEEMVQGALPTCFNPSLAPCNSFGGCFWLGFRRGGGEFGGLCHAQDGPERWMEHAIEGGREVC